jgi:hypothetical protein
MRKLLVTAGVIGVMALGTTVADAVGAFSQTTVNKALNTTAKHYGETCRVEDNSYYGQQISVCLDPKKAPKRPQIIPPKYAPSICNATTEESIAREEYDLYTQAKQELVSAQSDPSAADYYFVIVAVPTTDEYMQCEAYNNAHFNLPKPRNITTYQIAAYINGNIK